VSEPGSDDARQLRVVVADDDAFTLSLVGDGLRSQGFTVFTASSAEQAAELVTHLDPHALVSDLNFGAGMSGALLLRRVREEFPWVALVVLTSHQSPQLAVDDPSDVPTEAIYLVKSQLTRVEELGSAVTRAIAGQTQQAQTSEASAILVSDAQADVLRMLASGATTKAIAEKRGTTVRAAEAMVNRLYTTLGLEGDDLSAPRVTAIQLWQQGRVRVR
jgi:DNA-binding NarL/FixJ family response regulator